VAVAFADQRVDEEQGGGFVGWVFNSAATVLQFLTGLFAWLFIARLFDRFTRSSVNEHDEPNTPFLRLLRSVLLAFVVGAANTVFFGLLMAVLVGVTVGTGGSFGPPPPGEQPKTPAGFWVATILELPPFIWALLAFRKRPLQVAPVYGTYGRVLQVRVNIWLAVFRLLGTAIVCGLSLLPLSSLLLAFPAVNPQESVLTEAVSARAGFIRRTFRRLAALFAGLTVFLVLLAVSVEVVSRLPLPKRGSFAVVAKTFLFAPADFMGKTPKDKEAAVAKLPPPAQAFVKTPLYEQLPPAMVEHWPFVILGVYFGDLFVLLAVGKVPLAYNLRNVRVRWKTNAMTAWAFACVIGLLTFLLAFVNGMNNLTENTGVPGNVFVLSDGSTDEMFSNLGYGDLDNVERVVVTQDESNKPLPAPVRVKTIETGETVELAFPVPGADPSQTRTVRLRRFDDPRPFAKLHAVTLDAGGDWFSRTGSGVEKRTSCVLGDAVAAILGSAVGKSRLGVGDTFRLSDTEYVVTGVMKAVDSEYRSEIWTPRVGGPGKAKFLASRETYYAINQQIPLKRGEWETYLETHPDDVGKQPHPLRRRFVQVRSIEDADVAAGVHNVELYPGGRWFSASGVDGKSRIECVLGEGVAGVLGEDVGKKRLQPGDEFVLGDEKTMIWVVTGVMKSEGTTYGSEIWVKRFNRITKPFGKENYTTLVLRTEQDTIEASRAMAHHLSTRYTQQKLKAFAEPEYYAELTKTNNFFLTAVIIVAVVMAIGGVFGMMTTMFASIAQRIRDIGVLRLLGFKRWQVTISFLLESLTIATIGGAVGCLLAWFFADGKSSTSTLSGGGGGPGGKSFALTIDVDAQVMALGMTFTLVMGRLGGLVPALSAMRMKILDSLR
jgi:FtsX-like permease family/MacB-like periplasmic core domain